MTVRIQVIRPQTTAANIFAKPLTHVESPADAYNTPRDSYALAYGDTAHDEIRLEGFAGSSSQELAHIEGLSGQVLVKGKSLKIRGADALLYRFQAGGLPTWDVLWSDSQLQVHQLVARGILTYLPVGAKATLKRLYWVVSYACTNVPSVVLMQDEDRCPEQARRDMPMISLPWGQASAVDYGVRASDLG